MSAPLLIVGMHRSGTSMMTRVLMEQGVFLGANRQGDDEASFFLGLNRWIFTMAGTEWERPLPVEEMLGEGRNVETIVQIVRKRLRYPYLGEYFGWGRFPPVMDLTAGMPGAWGFKDPRTSITLPVWLSIFPKARILRMRRHGVDVASSLQTRYDRLRETVCGRPNRLARLGVSLPTRGRVVDAVRCATLEGALAVWAEYEAILDRSLSEVPGAQQLTVTYEDYVRDPAALHGVIGDFVGVPVTASLPQEVQPDPSRAHAWRRRPDLADFAASQTAVLAAGGYDVAA